MRTAQLLERCGVRGGHGRGEIHAACRVLARSEALVDVHDGVVVDHLRRPSNDMGEELY